ncbi:MAG: DUF6573 family protein [Planctomycetaceae bacterium]|nr:hypothetical protein [Planctomycetaceae bacterium]
MFKPIKPSKSGHLLDAETWDALRKAGVPEDQLSAEQPFGPVIFAYTRAQAIEDGVLVDVTALARRAGFTIHTAITCGVVAEVTEGMSDERMKQAALLAVLQTLRDCIRRSPNANTDRLEFDVAHWKLWAHVGPGDDAAPVLTIMLIGED